LESSPEAEAFEPSSKSSLESSSSEEEREEAWALYIKDLIRQNALPNNLQNINAAKEIFKVDTMKRFDSPSKAVLNLQRKNTIMGL
jgi:hypothetical protein